MLSLQVLAGQLELLEEELNTWHKRTTAAPKSIYGGAKAMTIRTWRRRFLLQSED